DGRKQQLVRVLLLSLLLEERVERLGAERVFQQCTSHHGDGSPLRESFKQKPSIPPGGDDPSGHHGDDAAAVGRAARPERGPVGLPAARSGGWPGRSLGIWIRAVVSRGPAPYGAPTPPDAGRTRLGVQDGEPPPKNAAPRLPSRARSKAACSSPSP